VLESLGVSLLEIRDSVLRIVGRGEEVTTGQIPFTPRAKKVLELSLREALLLGHNYIGTEHILLGIVREDEGVASRILLDFDLDAEKIRNATIAFFPGHFPHGYPRGPLPRAPRKPSVPRSTVSYATAMPERDHTALMITGASIATAGLVIGVALGWLIWG